VLGEVNVELLEVVIRIWVQAVLVVLNETQAGLSIDGKNAANQPENGSK